MTAFGCAAYALVIHICLICFYVAGTNWVLQMVNDMVAAIPSYKDLPPLENLQMLEFGLPTKVQVG